MIEFSVLRPSAAYGSPGEEMRLFLTEDGYQAALQSQQRREIKIKRYARVIEGHIPVSYTHLGKVDIVATVEGGGVSGQAGALRHGVARALLLVNPEYRTVLKLSLIHI